MPSMAVAVPPWHFQLQGPSRASLSALPGGCPGCGQSSIECPVELSVFAPQWETSAAWAPRQVRLPLVARLRHGAGAAATTAGPSCPRCDGRSRRGFCSRPATPAEPMAVFLGGTKLRQCQPNEIARTSRAHEFRHAHLFGFSLLGHACPSELATSLTAERPGEDRLAQDAAGKCNGAVDTGCQKWAMKSVPRRSRPARSPFLDLVLQNARI